MSQLTIHNVEHGNCITLEHDNGNVLMWDCGASESFSPTQYLLERGVNEIQHLFISNFDQDHLNDLPNLRANINIRSLYRNKSISADQLHSLKLQGGSLTNAMTSMIAMIESYNSGPISPPPQFPNITWKIYCNSYGSAYPDTNNISLVTFLTCGRIKLIIPGDIESSGWDGLLAQSGFADELREVDYFIASHHGRQNGYHEAIMNLCSPLAVIMSDGQKVHATQEQVQTYANHCRGIQFNGATRYVLTTRNDGSLTFSI
ncbi:MAG: MBL fold metallo-hydrolase [Pseudomonadota bacterium]